jgi:hypothetical protein
VLERASRPTATATATGTCLLAKHLSAHDQVRQAKREYDERALQAKQEKRAKWQSLRRRMQTITQDSRLAACGNRPTGRSPLGVKVKGGTASFSGLQSCGSISCCPVCGQKIRSKRAEEIKKAAVGCINAGGGLGFLTLTLPHDLADALKKTLGIVAKGFTRCISGRAWKKIAKEFGIHGTIRAVEVTCGCNGWHPHAHVIIFTDSPLTPAQWHRLRLYFYKTWADFVEAAKLRRPVWERCQLEPVRTAEKVAEYVAKALALEVTRQDIKAASGQSRTPIQILDDYDRYAGEDDRKRLLEYEAAMKGRQIITWSKGLKARYGVDDMTDEDAADGAEDGSEAGADGVADEFIPISDRELRAVVRAGAHSRVLDVAETQGAAGVRRLLDELVAADEASSLVWSKRGRVWRPS